MRFLLTRRRRGIPAMGTLRNVLRGHDGPWRQVEVLQGSRVQLQNGLICTKDRPTSMPTTRDQSSWPSVSSVAGRQGWWKTSEEHTSHSACRDGASNSVTRQNHCTAKDFCSVPMH